MKNSYQLHPYQTSGYLQTIRALSTELRTVLVMPTGSGKTIVARSVILRYLAEGLRVLFLSHRTQLNAQLIKKVGSHQHLAVSTIQGFSPDKCGNTYDLIVVDEAHRNRKAQYQGSSN